MSSKHRYSSSDDDSSSFDSYSDSSSDSEYHYKHKRKKKSKHSKHRDKHKKRRKKHRKDRKSRHKKRSKSKSKSKSKHKHKHNKKYNESETEIRSKNEPKRKKRKLNNNTDPCTSKEMINNAKKVLNMICDNDTIKQYMTNIFTKLDNNQSISIINDSFEQPLKMIFTFLSLNTKDNMNYTKTDQSISLLSIFKNELKTQKADNKSAITPSISKPEFIGPQLPSSNYKPSASSAIIGVTMPTNDDLINNKYTSSEDDDDDIGPAVLSENRNKNESKRLLQMEHTKIIAAMNKQIKGDENDGDNINNNDNKRAEWMTIMPETLISDYDKGTKQRGFNMNEHEHKRDNTWMETPNDIKTQKKEKKRIKKIEQETNEKLKLFGLPSVEEQRKRKVMMENDRNDGNMMDLMEQNNNNNNNKERVKSLFEIHQEKLMKEYKQDLKEWKRKKKKGEKVGPKPIFKGVKKKDETANFGGSMESYYDAQNPIFTRSKLNTFVNAGNIDNY